MLFLSIKSLPEKFEEIGFKTSSLIINISAKLPNPKVPKIGKQISMGLLLLSFLSGLQPTLAIPPVKESTVLAQTNTQDQIIQASSFSEAIQLPHFGYISTHYSSWHPGVDIATGLGTPIRPILKGQVISIEYGFWGLGHSVTIEHESGIRSTYGHMGRIYTQVGAQVTQTSIIGEVGLTGNTSGPHTHLELTKNGSYINPERILPNLTDLPPVTYEELTQKAPVKEQKSIQPIIKQENTALPMADSLIKNQIKS